MLGPRLLAATGVAALPALMAGMAINAATTPTAQAAPQQYCQAYARDAVRKYRLSLQRRCNFRGNRWHANFRRHYFWCLRASTAAANREAGIRNAQLRRCRPATAACPRIYRPVCGWRHGRWITYSNSCVARRAGAIRLRNGQCRTQAACTREYRPVCGWRNGRRITYANLCVARRAGATRIRQGRCPTGPTACPTVYLPVCGVLNGRRQTFSNACAARRSGATSIRKGQCPQQGAVCERYAKQALGIIRDIRRKRCAMPRTIFYTSNARTQFQICRQRTPQQRAQILASMNRYRASCRPTGGGDRACAIQIRKKLSLIARIRKKGCAMPQRADYSTNQSTQLRLCRQRAPRQRAGVLANMDGYLSKCRPAGGPGDGDAAKREACNRYANRALAQVARARQQGCFIQGANWSPNRGVHYSYCMSRGPAAANQLAQSRQQFLGACRPN